MKWNGLDMIRNW